MRILVFGAILALLLSSCDLNDLGFYTFPSDRNPGSISTQATAPGLEVVGYLPAYKIGTFNPAQIRHLTDLVYYTMTPRSDGELYWETFTEARRSFLQRVKIDYGVRILLGVTDHNREGALAAFGSKPAVRERFVTTLTAFLVREGFDGADFDWEYPGPDQQTAYSSLLQALHTDFAAHHLRLSIALSPSMPLQPAAYSAVDRVHAMTYDDFGRHSTLERGSDHIAEMVAQGVERSKILLGVPFYGRGYTASGPAWSSAMSYKTLRGLYRLEPGQDTVSGYYFNGIETVRRKVQFAKDSGLSGVMIWEIGQDTTDDTSLLAAISQAKRDLDRVN